MSYCAPRKSPFSSSGSPFPPSMGGVFFPSQTDLVIFFFPSTRALDCATDPRSVFSFPDSALPFLATACLRGSDVSGTLNSIQRVKRRFLDAVGGVLARTRKAKILSFFSERP